MLQLSLTRRDARGELAWLSRSLALHLASRALTHVT